MVTNQTKKTQNKDGIPMADYLNFPDIFSMIPNWSLALAALGIVGIIGFILRSVKMVMVMLFCVFMCFLLVRLLA